VASSGRLEQAAKKLVGGANDTPQALKRGHIFKRLNGTSKLAPFPFVEKSEFFRKLWKPCPTQHHV